jgi:hypothetical protein
MRPSTAASQISCGVIPGRMRKHASRGGVGLVSALMRYRGFHGDYTPPGADRSISSGTLGEFLELRSVSEVFTLSTFGAAVRWVTKA